MRAHDGHMINLTIKCIRYNPEPPSQGNANGEKADGRIQKLKKTRNTTCTITPRYFLIMKATPASFSCDSAPLYSLMLGQYLKPQNYLKQNYLCMTIGIIDTPT